MDDLISRQAAIDALRKMQTYKLFSGDDMLLIDQAGAQTELMMLPPAQPDVPDINVGDMISRKAAIDAVAEALRGLPVVCKDIAKKAIEQLPPAQLGTDLAEVGMDCISRQVAISAICSACGKIDCDKMDKCEKLQLPPANNSEIPNSSDTISRRAAIDATWEEPSYTDPLNVLTEVRDRIEALPSAQPEIIRCRDCKHYYFADNRIPQEQRYVCDIGGEVWQPDDYCSYAERR